MLDPTYEFDTPSERRKLFRLSSVDGSRLLLHINPLPSEEFYNVLALVKKFPARRWNPSLKVWEFEPTGPNVAYLRAMFAESDYDVDYEAGLALQYRDAVAKASEKSEAVVGPVWQYSRDLAAPAIDHASRPDAPPMFHHQLFALARVHNSSFYGLFADMGTGKTRIVVEECAWQTRLLATSERRSYKVLVVAPKTVLKAWEREFALWCAVPYWLARVRTGVSGMQLLLDCVRASDALKVLLCNYERLHSMKEALTTMKFDLVVADESIKIKNPRARMSQAAREIASTAGKRLLLTGAPVVNNVSDLWAQFEFLQPGSLGFREYRSFRWRYNVIVRTGGFEKVVGQANMAELKTTMAPLSLWVRKSECLDLPPKLYETRTVEMGEKQQLVYAEMRDWFLTALAEGEEKCEARSVLAQIVRLQQITSGYFPAADHMVSIPDGGVKLADLQELLEGHSEKFQVWCQFNEDVRRVCELLTSLDVPYRTITGATPTHERDTLEDEFNSSSGARGLVGNPEAGGMGLTLVGAPDNPCTLVVRYSNSYKLNPRLQAEDRSHRAGTTRPVTYVDIVCEDTVDERVVARLAQKKEILMDLQDPDFVRALL